MAVAALALGGSGSGRRCSVAWWWQQWRQWRPMRWRLEAAAVAVAALSLGGLWHRDAALGRGSGPQRYAAALGRGAGAQCWGAALGRGAVAQRWVVALLWHCAAALGRGAGRRQWLGDIALCY